jgi:hypothetical protein
VKRLRLYLFDVTEHALCTLCAMTGHAGTCWLLQGKHSPLRRFYFRAVDRRTGKTPRQATYHPKCRFCGADHDSQDLGKPSIEELMAASYQQGKLDGQQQAVDIKSAFKDKDGRIVVVQYPH